MSGAATHRQRELNALYAGGRLTWEQYETAYQAANRDPAQAKPRRAAKLDRAAPVPLPNYARSSSALYHDQRLSDGARRLVLKLIEWARGRGCVEAFVEQLADQLGLSVRATQYAQARAAECGYITIERTRAGRRNLANVYHLQSTCFPVVTRPRRSTNSRVQNPAPHEGRTSEEVLSPPLAPPPVGNLNVDRWSRSVVNAGASPLAFAPLGEKAATGGRSSKTVPSAHDPP